MKLRVTKAGELYVPEGAVVAQLTGYEEAEDTGWGPRLRLWFNDGKGSFGLWVSAKVNERSNLGKILLAMGYKLSEGDEIDLDEVVGKKVGLILAKNEAGFCRLMGAFPPDRAPF